MADRVNYKIVTLVPKVGRSISKTEINEIINRVTRSNIWGNELEARTKETLSVKNILSTTKSTPKWRVNPDKSKELVQTIKNTYFADDPELKELIYYTYEFYDPQLYWTGVKEKYAKTEVMNAALSELKSSGLFYYVEKGRLSPDTIKNKLLNDSYIVTEEEKVILDRYIPTQPSEPTQPGDNTGGGYIQDPSFVKPANTNNLLNTSSLNLDMKTIGMIAGIALLVILLLRK
jgi:hypothetical protein